MAKARRIQIGKPPKQQQTNQPASSQPANPQQNDCVSCGSIGTVNSDYVCSSCGITLNKGRQKKPFYNQPWAPAMPDVLPDLQTYAGFQATEARHWRSVAGQMKDTYQNLIAKALNKDSQAMEELRNHMPKEHYYPYVNADGKLVIGTKHRMFDRADLAHALSALDTDIGYDSFSNRTSVTNIEGEWVSINDRSHADLKYRIYENCVWETARKNGTGWDYFPVVVPKSTLAECVDGRCFTNQFDRFRTYLDECARKHPNIDEDYCRVLISSCFDVEDPNLAAEASEYILQIPVKRSCPEGAKADIMPILYGPQGCGKSSFLYNLVPQEVNVHCDSISFSGSSVDFAHQIDGKVIVEVPDMHGFRGAALEKIKAHLTRQDDHERRKYERYAITTHRRCVFIATENNHNSVPDDPTGNRRFVVIRLKAKMPVPEMVKFLKENRSKFWASVQKRIDKNGLESFLFTGLMARRQAEVNEEHRDRDDVIESIINGLDYTQRHTLDEVLDAASEIARAKSERFDRFSRAMPTRVKNALQNCGWEMWQTRNGKERIRAWHSKECLCDYCDRKRKKNSENQERQESDTAVEARFREQFDAAHGNNGAAQELADKLEEMHDDELLGAARRYVKDARFRERFPAGMWEALRDEIGNRGMKYDRKSDSLVQVEEKE